MSHQKITAAYVARYYVKDEEFLKHFLSIAEVAKWAEFNNLVLDGTGKRKRFGWFTVQRADGSPVNKKEKQAIGATLERFAKLAQLCQFPGRDPHPDDGLVHTAWAKLLTRG